MCLMLLVPAAVRGSVSVSVVASPIAIPADGNSRSQVLITALDQTGMPVQDGTEVQLTSSSGDITPVVFTSGGRAVGVLSSSTTAQTVTVTALVEGQSASAQVEFQAVDPEQERTSFGAINIEGGSLAYCVDSDTVFGSSGVSIEYGGTTVSAISAQVCQASGQIRAQGSVDVESGQRKLSGDALAWDINTGRIQLLDSSAQSDPIAYSAHKLDPVGAEGKAKNPRAVSPLASANGNNWIVCERLSIVVGKSVLFFKASIYVNDAKIITLPNYVYSYDQRQSFLQQVRVNSSDGVMVDFPFYYRMAASGLGALKLRYAADGSDIGGYSRPRKGMSIGLEQGYSIGENSRGTAFVDSVGSGSQAYELAHQMAFGPAGIGGQARLSARYQPSSEYGRNMYNAALSVTGSMGKYTYSFTGSTSGSSIPYSMGIEEGDVSYLRQSTGNLRTTIRPRSAMSVGGMGKITPSLALGYGSLWNASGSAASTGMYQTLGVNFTRTRPSRSRFSTGLNSSAAFTITDEGRTGSSFTVAPTLFTTFTGGNASIGYSLNLLNGINNSVRPSSRHMLSLNLGLSGGGKWNTTSMISYGVDSGRLNLFSRLNYNADRQWRISSSYDLYRYSYSFNSRSFSYSTSYFKAGLYRVVGAYEIGLAWSPDGRNYGLEKNRRVWLEFGGRGF